MNYRDKNKDTIWIPFPKEFENKIAILHCSYHKGNDGKIYSVNYFLKPDEVEYKNYHKMPGVGFTLGEKDVSFNEKVLILKEKILELIVELKNLL